MEAGEKEFLENFEKYSDKLFRHALFRLSNKERAEEIVQECFMKTWDYLRKGNEVKQYSAFLYRTLNNMIVDEYRNLEGGDEEPTETDPMIGWHGIRRGLDEPEILKAEFEAVKRVHDMGHNNVGIMLRFLFNVDVLVNSIVKSVTQPA